MNNGGACTLKNHGPVRYRLGSRDIKTERNAVVSVRPWGMHHLTSINLGNCTSISDIGISALAEGCRHLASINLTYCTSISDIGVSAIAEGCHDLTSDRKSVV